MQDRFKFRAWDKKRQKYIYNIQNGAEVYDYHSGHTDYLAYNELLEADSFIKEQCTGLKDKNGKLIYEGDIVQVDSMVYYSEPLTLVIGFHNGAFMAGDRHIDNNSIFMEIVGNVHDNSELLEE